MLDDGFHQQGRIWDSSRPWLAVTLLFFLSCLFFGSPHFSCAYLYFPSSFHSTCTLAEKYIYWVCSTLTCSYYSFYEGEFFVSLQHYAFLLSWGLTIINSLKMGLMLKWGNVFLCCKIKCFRTQDSLVERRAIIWNCKMWNIVLFSKLFASKYTSHCEGNVSVLLYLYFSHSPWVFGMENCSLWFVSHCNGHCAFKSTFQGPENGKLHRHI